VSNDPERNSDELDQELAALGGIPMPEPFKLVFLLRHGVGGHGPGAGEGWRR